MNRHFTKARGDSLSQNVPFRATKVASNVTQTDPYVLLCDLRGQTVWKSGTSDRAQIGEEIRKHPARCPKESFRSAWQLL